IHWNASAARFCSQSAIRGILMETATQHRLSPARSNSLKLRALEIFRDYGRLNPAAWAVLANMKPLRSSYSYLLRLYRFGLLNRERDSSGFLFYTISARGKDRLNWLISQMPPSNPK